LNIFYFTFKLTKSRANIPIGGFEASSNTTDNSFLLYGQQPQNQQATALHQSLKQSNSMSAMPFYSASSNMIPQQQQAGYQDMSLVNTAYNQYFTTNSSQQPGYSNSFYNTTANNGQFDMLVAATASTPTANISTPPPATNLAYMSGGDNDCTHHHMYSYLCDAGAKKMGKLDTSAGEGHSLTQLQNVCLSKNKGVRNGYEDEFDDENDDDEDEEDSEEDDDEDEYDDEEYSSGDENEKLKRPLASKSNSNNQNTNHEQFEQNGNNETSTGYMSSLFNSPSSLSSTGQNKKSTGKVVSNGKSTKSLAKSGRKLTKKQVSAAVKLEMSETNNEQAMNQPQLELLDESNAMSAASSSNFSKHSHYHHHHFQRSHAHQEAYDLAGILDDYELVNLPLRELNKRLRYLPKQMAYGMKKRRRTLKNRKYAQNCRSKRLEQKSEMEVQNCHLKHEIGRLHRLIESLKHENAMLKSFVNSNEASSMDLNGSGRQQKSGDMIPPNQHNNSSSNHLVNTTQTNGTTSATATNAAKSNGTNSQLTHLHTMIVPLAKSDTNGMSNQ
jgi:hypothetical protein